MLSPGDETRRSRIIEHMHGTRCYLVADHTPCNEAAVRQQAANRMRATSRGPVGRDIVPLAQPDFVRAKAPPSWLAIVLLRPGDDLAGLVVWAKEHRAALDRIHFYHQAGLDPRPLLKPWADAGLPAPRVEAFHGQRDLSAPIGRLINRHIDADHGPVVRRPPV